MDWDTRPGRREKGGRREEHRQFVPWLSVGLGLELGLWGEAFWLVGAGQVVEKK